MNWSIAVAFRQSPQHDTPRHYPSALRSHIAMKSLARIADVVIVLAFVVYVASYFWMSGYSKWETVDGFDTEIVRTYPRDWMVYIYEPAASIESSIRGYDVYAHVENRDFLKFSHPPRHPPLTPAVWF